MNIITRSRLLREEEELEKDILRERKLIKPFIICFRKKYLMLKNNKIDYKELKKLNHELIFYIKRIEKIKQFEDSIISLIIKEVDKYLDKTHIKESKELRKNAERIKEFSQEIIHILEEQNEQIIKQNNPEITKLITKEHELEKEFDLVITNMLREIKDLIKNTKEKKPLISVIIPAYNEDKYIRKTLHSAKRQTYPNKEIIVVNNASEDLTSEKIKPYSYKELYLSEKGISLAKNTGARKAHGDILVFLDADSVMRKDLLEKVYEAYEEGFVAAVSKAIFDKRDFASKLTEKALTITRTMMFKVPAQFVFVKKEVFFQVNGFDERLGLGEDADLTKKIMKLYGRRSVKIIMDSGIITSARRFNKKGYIRTFALWTKGFFIRSPKTKYDDTIR